MRTCTRAGRPGVRSERKSRAGAWWSQNGQSSGSGGATRVSPSATGASHEGQASVPWATTADRTARRSSWTTRPSESGRTGCEPSMR